MTTPSYQTRDELRAFLRLCLTPGHGREKRSVETLARLMHPWLLDDIAEYAPHLMQLRTAADTAQANYLTALETWITAETIEPPAEDTPR
ncbi:MULTISPECIES: hypothetical protein [unclassified Streptomyces]|uniref:hypothetical protein n=1 Tax=unclassified Streptomyces TaxID=2593676 RepID=UPI00093ADBD7|nr:hypothetical protein [Streptomyces sp. TSRI0281]OKI34968.1 hypothetical protein A6A29_16210 [Streptomyces sp. TSRI0281]